jgi:hypothetical protein
MEQLLHFEFFKHEDNFKHGWLICGLIVLAHIRALFGYISKLNEQDIPDPIMNWLFPRLFLLSISPRPTKIEEFLKKKIYELSFWNKK